MKPTRPPVIYPDGFFTDPVRAWKQLAFVSAIQIDPRTKRYATAFQLAQKHRQAGGFDKVNKDGAKLRQLQDLLKGLS